MLSLIQGKLGFEFTFVEAIGGIPGIMVPGKFWEREGVRKTTIKKERMRERGSYLEREQWRESEWEKEWER